MKRISQPVFVIKWFVPGLFVLVAIAMLSLAFLDERLKFNPVVLLGPVMVLTVGIIVFRMLVWDLADEVRDGGDYLLVRRGRIEERVPLTNIMNVSASVMVNPPRIELRLLEPNRFGNRIVFSPAKNGSLNPFARNAVAEDLIVRVDQARANRKR